MAPNPKNNTTSTLEQVAQDIWNEDGYTICADGYKILSKGEVVATLTPFSTDNGSDVGMCACDAVEIVFNELGGVFTNNPRFVEISKRHWAVDPDMDSDAGRQIYIRFCNDLIAANRNMDPHPDGLRQRIMAVFKDLMSRRLVLRTTDPEIDLGSGVSCCGEDIIRNLDDLEGALAVLIK